MEFNPTFELINKSIQPDINALQKRHIIYIDEAFSSLVNRKRDNLLSFDYGFNTEIKPANNQYQFKHKRGFFVIITFLIHKPESFNVVYMNPATNVMKNWNGDCVTDLVTFLNKYLS